MTDKQRIAFFKVFQQAADRQCIPPGEREAWRHEIVREACGVPSLKAVGSGADFDRLMAHVSRLAEDHAEAIRWATSEGVVTGYGNGLFGSNDPITREQLATMLWRYAQTEDYDVSVGEDTNILSYADVGDLAEYAIPAMQWAVGAGIITGTGNGSTLTPQGNATRAQAAVMLQRFCEEYMTW